MKFLQWYCGEMKRKKGTAAADDPSWPHPQNPAPGDLRLVQAFVGTAVGAGGAEELTSPAALVDWLARWRLIAPGAKLTPADLERAVAVRAALRALIRINSGASPHAEALARLDAAAVEAPLVVRFGRDGSVRLEPSADGLASALGRLFATVTLARRDGLWRRVKLCANSECGRVFYDQSPNRSGRWCTNRCRSLLNARTYRRRHPHR